MALDFTKQSVNSGFASTDTLEENFDNIETALTDGLSRSGNAPNAMNADLDMNSNDILNINAADVVALTINGIPVQPDSIVSAELPDQSGNSGKYLTTNGTTASWGTLTEELPDQTGNSGKYLITDGNDPSWVTIAPAQLGLNVYNEASELLEDIDVRNDLLVTEALGGFENANASMEFSRVNENGKLMPASWFASDSDGVDTYYEDNDTRDALEINDGTDGFAQAASAAFPISPNFNYEIVIVAKLAAGEVTGSFVVKVAELNSDLPVDKKAINVFGATGETGKFIASDQDQTVIPSQAVTSSYQLFTGTYEPTVGAKWASIDIKGDAGYVVVDLCGIRRLKGVAFVNSTDANKTLASTDDGDITRFTDTGGSTTVTVDQNSLGRNGASWVGIREGSSTLSINKGSGVTFASYNGNGNQSVANVGGLVRVTQLSTTLFVLEGNLT